MNSSLVKYLQGKMLELEKEEMAERRLEDEDITLRERNRSN
jgi:hypothetical protein